MAIVELLPSGPKPCAESEHNRILRFRASERHVHWALAVPFMVCYSTALILVTVYNPNPARPFRQIVSWTHRLSGLCLLALPLLTLVRHWRDAAIHAHNIRQVWRWNREDVKWLCLIGPASFNRRISLPHQGKFNAGEKINFMSVSSTYSIYILTGLCIWLGLSPYLCWLVHFTLALSATPLLIGHILMATVNPDTRPGLMGMITGFVDREWANHHYHLWYHEHYGRTAHREQRIPATAAPTFPGAVLGLGAERADRRPPLPPAAARRPAQDAPEPVGATSRAPAAPAPARTRAPLLPDFAPGAPLTMADGGEDVSAAS